MGAALHLAHVHQAPVQKRKRKGGGSGGDGYDALVARVYQDGRMTPESRELILLLAWLANRDPDRFDADGNFVNWRDRATRVLGEYGPGPRRGSRLADLLYADRPRYEDIRGPYEQRTCAAPMIRRQGLCGQPGSSYDYRVDQATGWRTAVWYCRRHEAWGHALREQRLAEPGPEPIPNAGGLVTSYFLMDGQAEAWARLYTEAAVWKGDLSATDSSGPTGTVRSGSAKRSSAGPVGGPRTSAASEKRPSEARVNGRPPVRGVGPLLPVPPGPTNPVQDRDRYWQPPRSYSIRADDWPTPGKDPIPAKARLRLVLGGGGDA